MPINFPKSEQLQVAKYSSKWAEIECGTFLTSDRNGDQEEKDEWDRIWEENSPTADEHLDKMDDLEKKKPLTKDERLALIKKSAEKKSAHDNESW